MQLPERGGGGGAPLRTRESGYAALSVPCVLCCFACLGCCWSPVERLEMRLEAAMPPIPATRTTSDVICRRRQMNVIDWLEIQTVGSRLCSLEDSTHSP